MNSCPSGGDPSRNWNNWDHGSWMMMAKLVSLHVCNIRYMETKTYLSHMVQEDRELEKKRRGESPSAWLTKAPSIVHEFLGIPNQNDHISIPRCV